jgi:ubiquinone biosynthesis protein
MTVLKYLASIRRLVVIGAIVSRQAVMYLPYRRRYSWGLPKEPDVRRYLKTRRPGIDAPEFARRTLEKLGPTFIKFGQFLSIRPDLIPAEFCHAFRGLQDHVAPFAYEQVREQLANELRCNPDAVFSEFDQEPVAAASVSQVHRARLRSGEEVAVKVQRPHVRRHMEEDIVIMLFFARLLDRMAPALRKNQLVMLVHEFSRWTDRELDFVQEAKHALHFSYCFASDPSVKIPAVFLEYTTERLLVMEFIRGVNMLDAPSGSFDRQKVAHLIADSMLRQIFVSGFFHGDPHAGNIFLIGDSAIAYIDFGIVGYLTKEVREWTFDILYGMSNCDISRIIDCFLELCDVDLERVDVRAYRREMNEVLSELYICEIANVPFTHMMERFLNVSLEFGIDVPHDFVIMSKAIATLEGTCLSLDPGIRIVEYLKPFVERYVGRAPDLQAALDQLRAGPFEAIKLKRLVLKHGARALRLLERPTFRVEGTEFGSLVAELEKSSVNVAYGVLIGALLVFAATVSNKSSFELWLQSRLGLPDVALLSLASLMVACLLWLRLVMRNRRESSRARRFPRR